MSKRILMLAMGMLILFLGVVFAEDKVRGKTESYPYMMGQGMMKQKMMKQGMMAGHMMDKKIVATQDGGVVVLIGNKLAKYDKQLNLIKEVELKVNMPQMSKEMMEDVEDGECPVGGEFQPAYPYHRKQGTSKTEEE